MKKFTLEKALLDIQKIMDIKYPKNNRLDVEYIEYSDSVKILDAKSFISDNTIVEFISETTSHEKLMEKENYCEYPLIQGLMKATELIRMDYPKKGQRVMIYVKDKLKRTAFPSRIWLVCSNEGNLQVGIDSITPWHCWGKDQGVVCKII